MGFEDRIEEMFLDLPEAPQAAGGAALASRSGKLLFLSGVLPHSEGRLLAKGRVGMEVSLDAGVAAARAAVVQALGILRSELGSLDKIKNIVHLRLYVSSGPEFRDHKKVASGALELLREIFGTHGRCAYEVAGSPSLPDGAAVELALIVETK